MVFVTIVLTIAALAAVVDFVFTYFLGTQYKDVPTVGVTMPTETAVTETPLLPTIPTEVSTTVPCKIQTDIFKDYPYGSELKVTLEPGCVLMWSMSVIDFSEGPQVTIPLVGYNQLFIMKNSVGIVHNSSQISQMVVINTSWNTSDKRYNVFASTEDGGDLPSSSICQFNDLMLSKLENHQKTDFNNSDRDIYVIVIEKNKVDIQSDHRDGKGLERLSGLTCHDGASM